MNHKLMIPLKCMSVFLAVLFLGLFLGFPVHAEETHYWYNDMYLPVVPSGSGIVYQTILVGTDGVTYYVFSTKKDYTSYYMATVEGDKFRVLFQGLGRIYSYDSTSDSWVFAEEISSNINSRFIETFSLGSDSFWTSVDMKVWDGPNSQYLDSVLGTEPTVVSPSESPDPTEPVDPDTPTSAEMPVFTVNVPLVPWYEYNVGDTPDPISVTATVSDGGTVSYIWFKSDWTNYDDISRGEISTGNTLTIDTSTVGEYHYLCKATNTNGSFVNSRYSNTLVVKIVESGAADLPEPTPTYPSADDIGSSVGDAFQDVLDQNDINTSEQGNSFVDQITQIVPNESQGFVNAMGGLVDSLSYDGTECVLTVPALVMPQIGDLVPQYTLLEKQTVDLECYFNMFPAFIVTLVQSLFTVALIVFCFKELYSTVSYFFVLRGGET